MEVSEVADVGGAVGVRPPAGHAVLGVGGVGESLPGDGGIVQAEAEDVGAALRDVGDQWIVGVGHRPRRRVELGHRAAPPLGDELELAVAVELVAKEVSEADGLRPHAAADVGKRPLVDFEEPQLGIGVGEEGGGHPGHEVCAGAVVGEADPAPQGAGHDGRGGRLAVRAGDERGAQGQSPGQGRERARIDRGEQLPRQRRSPAAPGEPRDASRCARGRDFKREAHRGKSTSLERVNLRLSPGRGMPGPTRAPTLGRRTAARAPARKGRKQ